MHPRARDFVHTLGPLVVGPLAVGPLAVGAALWGTSIAHAHLGHVVVSAERYLKLDASEADTRLVVSLTLGPGEGRAVLAAADTDHDGTVSAAEADAYLAEWGRGLETELRVEIDGAVTPLVFTEPYLDPIGPVASVPVTVEMVAHVPVVTNDADIIVVDRMVRREIFDRTEVAFRGHDGAEIVASGAGRNPTTRELDLAFGRSARLPMPDELAARIRYPNRAAPTPAGATAAWPWLIASIAACAAALGIWRLRRR